MSYKVNGTWPECYDSIKVDYHDADYAKIPFNELIAHMEKDGDTIHPICICRIMVKKELLQSIEIDENNNAEEDNWSSIENSLFSLQDITFEMTVWGQETISQQEVKAKVEMSRMLPPGINQGQYELTFKKNDKDKWECSELPKELFKECPIRYNFNE